MQPLLLLLLPAAAASSDASALVQGAVRAHLAAEEAGLQPGSRVESTAEGPVATTRLGRILGAEEEGCVQFRAVPYAEKPRRFEVAEPLKPWAPETLKARDYGPGCIGSGVGGQESEDCLHLNIWVPKGGRAGLPVVVYFHGGLNQHGSGAEFLRRGDAVVQSARHPTIFINMDFRLGIFGWIDLKGSNLTSNIGLLDQQAALRWVHDHIGAFGGDPSRVTLQGQSEGSGIIAVHMVAPGSRGLFSRVAFHSPVKDMWSRTINAERTAFMISRLGCQRLTPRMTVACLRSLDARKLWGADWVAEELSRGVGSEPWKKNFGSLLTYTLTKSKSTTKLAGDFGWHAVVDGKAVPGEPRELIRRGDWSKVPVLMTISKNETYGCIPQIGQESVDTIMETGLKYTMEARKVPDLEVLYAKSLAAAGVPARGRAELLAMMVTDSLWTCDVRSYAADIVRGGGQAFVGMFWHSPRYDFVGRMSNPICEHGATCHAAEMLYVLPQGGERGIHGRGMEDELRFAREYSDHFLEFVHGRQHPWAPYDLQTQPMTFMDAKGARVVPGYRRQQCDILDSSVGPAMPLFLQRAVKRR